MINFIHKHSSYKYKDQQKREHSVETLMAIYEQWLVHLVQL